MQPVDMKIAVKALWLQYQGLTAEPAHTLHRVGSVAWKTSPLPQPEDLPEVSGLMIAT